MLSTALMKTMHCVASGPYTGGGGGGGSSGGIYENRIPLWGKKAWSCLSIHPIELDCCCTQAINNYINNTCELPYHMSFQLSFVSP